MRRGATTPMLSKDEEKSNGMAAPIPILSANTSVSRAMTSLVISVRPENSLEEILHLFLNRGISGAPVLDDKERPVGIVTKTDLLREINDRGDTQELQSGLESGYHVEHIARSTASEIMTPVVYVLNVNAPIAKAAPLMAYEGIHRIPIVDDSGRLVGILSALDVLRWLAKENGYRL